MNYTSNDLITFFGHHTFGKGMDYVRQHRVRECRAVPLPDGLAVVAQVQGAGRNVYRVNVQVRAMGRRAYFETDCECPVGVDCKHAVAALVEVMRQQPRGTRRGAPATPRSPLEDWLEGLRAPLAPAAAPSAPQRLAYVLMPGPAGLQVRPHLVRLLKKGGYGSSRKALGYYDTDPAPYYRKEYHRELDLRILGTLRALGTTAHDAFTLQGEAGAAVLALLLRTGHCHWQDLDTPALEPGAPLPLTVSWEARDGGYRLTPQWPRAGLELLPCEPPYYCDPEQHRCGPLVTGHSGAVLEKLLDSPVLSAADVDRQALRLLETLPRLQLPLPPPIEVTRVEGVVPMPRLHLYNAELSGDGQRFRLPVAELTFRYGDHALPDAPAGARQPLQAGGTLIEIERDIRREAECRAALAELVPVRTLAPRLAAPPGLRAAEAIPGWLAFMAERLPALRTQGWQIDIAPDFDFRLLPFENWYGDIDEGGRGTDWFDLELGVVVNGARLNLLPLLTEALRGLSGAALQQLQAAPDSDALPLPTAQGLLLLPMARLKPLLATLVELFDHEPLRADGRLRLSRLDSARLPDLPLPWTGGEKLRELGKRLHDFHGIAPVAPPADFGATLRPYQQAGLNWLQFLRGHDLNGVLADDMGLGKTVQALAHLLLEKQAGRLDRPCLVLAPTSLMHNWRREAARFAPQLRLLTLHGPDRRQHFDAIAEHDLVLTTYPLLARDSETLQRYAYHYLILDEAQVLKNPKAKATQQVQQLDARHRLALTGTPLENHLGELWSLFNVLMPGLLGAQARFNQLYRQPIEKAGDTARRNALARRLSPFMLRRRKEQVATELPPKTDILRSVSLDGAQRDLYESLRLSMDKKLRAEIGKKGFARSRIMILDALLKLRQVCCDPRLLTLESARKVQGSAKLELLMELLPELLAEGRRVLLFSQFTTMLGLIETELDKRQLPYVKLTGQTRDRAMPVQRFQEGEVPLFLISLKAGGVGLNLTAADTVIHYDPWWNPAVEQQATDRAYRIGQHKPVFVYKLLTEGTVEEKILALQGRKAALAQGIYGEGGTEGPDFSGADLEELLRPLD